MLKQALKRTQKKWTGAVRLESVRQAGRQDTERTRSQTFCSVTNSSKHPRWPSLAVGRLAFLLLAGLELARRRVDAEPRLSVCAALECVRVCACRRAFDEQRRRDEGAKQELRCDEE